MDSPTPKALRDFATQLCDTLPSAIKRTMAEPYEQLLAEVTKRTYQRCFLVGQTAYFPNQAMHHQSMVRGVQHVPALPHDLMPAFQAWEQPFKQLTGDMARIKQTIGSLLMRTKSWQDVRNLFPEHFVSPLLQTGYLAGLQRTAPDLLDPAADWDPKLVRMYDQVSGLISLYLGYKLL